jgi:hypothetical protein
VHSSVFIWYCDISQWIWTRYGFDCTWMWLIKCSKKKLPNTKIFKHTSIITDDYLLTCHRSWQHQLPKHCVRIKCPKMYCKRWGEGRGISICCHKTLYFPQEVPYSFDQHTMLALPHPHTWLRITVPVFINSLSKVHSSWQSNNCLTNHGYASYSVL